MTAADDGTTVLCCDWCEATIALDDESMVVHHVDPESGADCPGSHGDDYHKHFVSSVANHPLAD
jgi:hypothetical protein